MSPDIARRVEMRVRFAEGEAAARLAKIRAATLEKSPAFLANWAIQRSSEKVTEVGPKGKADELQKPRMLER